MSKLDDLFRRSHAQEPPAATPPPGQWLAIQRDLRKDGESGVTGGGTLNGWLGIAMAGVAILSLVVGLTAVYTPDSAPQPPALQEFSQPIQYDSREATEPVRPPAREREGSRTINAPTPLKPQASARQRGGQPLTANGRYPDQTVKRTTEIFSSTVPPETHLTPSGIPSTVKARGKRSILPLPTLPIGPEITPIHPTPIYAADPKPFLPAHSAPVPFREILRAANQRPRTEIGLSVGAWNSTTSLLVNSYGVDPTPFDRAGVAAPFGNGRIYRRGAAEQRSINHKQALGTRVGYLEVARQQPGGLRLLAGLTAAWKANSINFDSDVRQKVLEENGIVGASLRNGEEVDVFLSFAAQYTINRGGRLRFSPGIALLYHVHWTVWNSTTYYYSKDTFESFAWQEENASGGSTRRTSIIPLPSLNIQYQLTPRLALAGDLSPGFGLGARYRFY